MRSQWRIGYVPSPFGGRAQAIGLGRVRPIKGVAGRTTTKRKESNMLYILAAMPIAATLLVALPIMGGLWSRSKGGRMGW